MKINPVVHFEMPAGDSKRMSEFYTNAFGWQTQDLGEKMGNYTLAMTGETDEQGMPQKTGMINGGFYPRHNDKPPQYPSLVISVDDLEEAMKKITEAGGRILGEPEEIPGYGTYVSFFDTEGNRNSVIQPSMEKM